MIKKDIEAARSTPEQSEKALKKPTFVTELVILLGAFALILCILLMAAPLQRLASTPTSAHTPGGNFLVQAGSWLPSNLHITRDPYGNQLGTGNVEFLLLMAIAFGIYGVCALLVQLLPHRSSNRGILPLIWLGAIVTGLIFLLAPYLLSHDVFVYAGYGRLINVYHANPYFVPLSAYGHDLIYRLDDWGNYTAAYGPLWMVVCSFSTLLAGADPLRYILFFRLFGLAAHLINILLVTLILRKMGRSPRTVALGVLLYAWNPLVLLESSHGGHNDIFMITFILLGILFAVRAEQSTSTRLRGVILPIIAFTLAALVKYTTVPLIVLFIIALAVRALRPDAAISLDIQEHLAHRWKPALLTALSACITSGIVILAFYGPFFVGHSLQTIAHSFTAPPSSRSAHKSILDGVFQQIIWHPSPPGTLTHALLYQLNRHGLWNLINIVTLTGGVIIGAFWLWRTPTTRTFVLASLLTLGAFLIVAPWFLPWYVTCLVALAVVCLPVIHEPFARGLVAFAMAFSVTVFVLYLYNAYPPANIWNLWSCLFTFGPPLVAFLFAIIPWHPIRRPVTDATVSTPSTRTTEERNAAGWPSQAALPSE